MQRGWEGVRLAALIKIFLQTSDKIVDMCFKLNPYPVFYFCIMVDKTGGEKFPAGETIV